MTPIKWPNLCNRKTFPVYNLWQFGCFMLTVTTNKALHYITADIYNHLIAIYNWWQSLTWNVNIGSFSSSALITLLHYIPMSVRLLISLISEKILSFVLTLITLFVMTNWVCFSCAKHCDEKLYLISSRAGSMVIYLGYSKISSSTV